MPKREPKIAGGSVKVRVTCLGLMPYKQDKPPEGLIDILWDPGLKIGGSQGQKPTPREACEDKVYRSQVKAGWFCVPLKHLYPCLVHAGQLVKLDGNRQVSTATSTLLPGLIQFDQPDFPMFAGDEKKKATWEVDKNLGRNKKGEMIPCICARFDQWGFKVEITVNTDRITMTKVRSLWDIAGAQIGIGVRRPNRKGFNGTFKVVDWEIVAEVGTKAA